MIGMSTSPSRAASLTELVQARDALVTRIAALRQELIEAEDALKLQDVKIAAHAPIYRLPDDVLRQIFEDAYEHDLNDRKVSCTTPHHDPLAASHVCQVWRATVLSMPKIWRCIHTNRPWILLRKLWVERSGGLPLRITIIVGKHNVPAERLYHPHVKGLIKYISRWEHLQVVAQSPIFIRYVCEEIRSAGTVVPQLRSLSLQNTAIPREHLLARIPFPLCPNLKFLVLRQISLFSVNHPMPKLETVRLRRCLQYDDQSLDDITLSAASISELVIHENTATSPFAQIVTDEKTSFSHLHTIVFRSIGFNIYFFSCYELPALRTLVCTGCFFPIHGMTMVSQMPTLPCLTHITIDDCNVAHGISTFAKFLQYASATLTLTLRGKTDANVVLALLANHHYLVPQLQTLVIDTVAVLRGDAVVHLGMVRRDNGRPLASIRLGKRARARMDDESFEALQLLMDVSVI